MTHFLLILHINNIFLNKRKLFAGSLIYRLRGIDTDGDILTFGVRDQPGSDVIRVENFGLTEANIYLNKLLDREVIFTIYIIIKFLTFKGSKIIFAKIIRHLSRI